MKEQEQILLEIESSLGDRYQKTWDELVKPYFELKEVELFEVFKQTASTDTEGLVMLRLQCNALEGLRANFMHYISTGQMAKQTLNDKFDGDNDG